nr:CHRD domain-containing protein [Brevibacillus laterosporus]
MVLEVIIIPDYVANLRGEKGVPPVRTMAFGQATFRISADQHRIPYQLSVYDIQNMTQAHIHLGGPRENGPVVVFLYGKTQGISVDRGTVQGTIMASNLVGPLAGRPLSDLIQQMNAGNTYVNVHTERHPDGEIRGQVRVVMR